MMPTRNSASSQTGMTIIEVLMVVFIVGLTAGIVTLTIPQRPTVEQASAQAFATVLRDAQDHAILSGQPTGIKLTETGYTFVQWRRDQWQIQGRPETLPRRLNIIRRTEGEPVSENWPDIVFDPSGIIETAEFELRGRGTRINIALNPTGEVSLVER